MKNYTVLVGGKVVAVFHQLWRAQNFVRKVLAPGCKPYIQAEKRPLHIARTYVGAKHCSEARQFTNRVGNYEKVPRLLKPGDFIL